MKENCLNILLPFVVVMLTLPLTTLAREVDPCRLFPNGTKLRDPDDCSRAITCVDFKSVYGTKICSGSTPFYNKDTDACVKSLTDNSSCTIDCTNSAHKFLSDPKSCFGYFYCQDEVLALYGHCPEPYHFNETVQACVYTHESDCTVKTLNICAIVKDNVNFKDESSCVNYNVCKKGKLTTADCSKTGYYDAATGKCVKKSAVDCPAHPIPKNVCGTERKPLKNVFVNDEATCRGHFFCADVEGPDPNPTWHQCPKNTFFNKDTQMCDYPFNVACGEDRCDGRTLTFVSSGTKGCRHYLRCANGVTVEELTCGNRFFDEVQGVCTPNVVLYPSCKG